MVRIRRGEDRRGFARVARRGALVAAVGAVLVVGGAPIASADFPYTGPNGNPHDPTTWKLPPGVTPSNFGDNWKLAATPEQSTQNEATVNPKGDELCGIRGMSVVDKNATFPSGTGSCVAAGSPVSTAFEVTLGRPDVLISELDSGIEWNNAGAMTAVRKTYWINPGELPAPRDDLATTFDPSTGVNCAAHAGAVGQGGDYNSRGGTRQPDGMIPYDILGQGAFNVLDYACDSRVAAVVTGSSPLHALRHGPAGMLIPEDLILAFSDGIDHDHDGFANDIAGWNFVDNNNDPYDDVQYGHGTGEVQDSAGEANTSSTLGTCPDCRIMPLRVGESFIADVNRFAQAVRVCDRQGRRRDPGAAGDAQQLELRARRGRVRLPPRDRDDRLRRRRGRRAQQRALGRCPTRSSSTRSTSTRRDRGPAVVPPVQRLYQLRAEGDCVGVELVVLLERDRAGAGIAGLVYSAAITRSPRAGSSRPLTAHAWIGHPSA